MKIVIIGAGTAGLITALILKEKYPAYQITIIKSDAIGIVGVGEGSTEHWAWFMDYVGINNEELLHETRATVKVGILFKDWHLGPDYVHSISSFELSSLNRPELFNHLYLNGVQEDFPLSPHFKTIYNKNLIALDPNFRSSNQYHFDTFKLGSYLSKICLDRDITIEDNIVTDVILNSNGDVQELVAEQENISGDLFIDCSGFKRILSSKLGNMWISKTDYLPLNRAIAFPTEQTDPQSIEPYTTSTALSAGWSWRIPTQDRYGNGYVFNTNYIDSDKALSELSQALGVSVEKFARDIPFEAGKVDKFWFKNVISVGLAGSFAEPLEAQSIGFTIVQSQVLLDYLDAWPFRKNVCEDFNKQMDSIFDNIIDYLQLHYLGDRKDAKFWQDKPFKLTEFNKENLPLFKRGIFQTTEFKNNYMFKVANFYQVTAGLNLINKDILTESFNLNRATYNNTNYNRAIEILDSFKTRSVMSHREYLNLASYNYLHKRGLNESRV
jgi:tryptophan halogenase